MLKFNYTQFITLVSQSEYIVNLLSDANSNNDSLKELLNKINILEKSSMDFLIEFPNELQQIMDFYNEFLTSLDKIYQECIIDYEKTIVKEMLEINGFDYDKFELLASNDYFNSLSIDEILVAFYEREMILSELSICTQTVSILQEKLSKINELINNISNKNTYPTSDKNELKYLLFRLNNGDLSHEYIDKLTNEQLCYELNKKGVIVSYDEYFGEFLHDFSYSGYTYWERQYTPITMEDISNYLLIEKSSLRDSSHEEVISKLGINYDMLSKFLKEAFNDDYDIYHLTTEQINYLEDTSLYGIYVEDPLTGKKVTWTEYLNFNSDIDCSKENMEDIVNKVVKFNEVEYDENYGIYYTNKDFGKYQNLIYEQKYLNTLLFSFNSKINSYNEYLDNEYTYEVIRKSESYKSYTNEMFTNQELEMIKTNNKLDGFSLEEIESIISEDDKKMYKYLKENCGEYAAEKYLKLKDKKMLETLKATYNNWWDSLWASLGMATTNVVVGAGNFVEGCLDGFVFAVSAFIPDETVHENIMNYIAFDQVGFVEKVYFENLGESLNNKAWWEYDSFAADSIKSGTEMLCNILLTKACGPNNAEIASIINTLYVSGKTSEELFQDFENRDYFSDSFEIIYYSMLSGISTYYSASQLSNVKPAEKQTFLGKLKKTIDNKFYYKSIPKNLKNKIITYTKEMTDLSTDKGKINFIKNTSPIISDLMSE